MNWLIPENSDNNYEMQMIACESSRGLASTLASSLEASPTFNYSANNGSIYMEK